MKLLLLAINEGRDENDGSPVAENVPKLNNATTLKYEEVTKRIFKNDAMACRKKYVNTMNVIHFMHDKYNPESAQMALHDTIMDRNMAFGIAGFSLWSIVFPP